MYIQGVGHIHSKSWSAEALLKMWNGRAEGALWWGVLGSLD